MNFPEGIIYLSKEPIVIGSTFGINKIVIGCLGIALIIIINFLISIKTNKNDTNVFLWLLGFFLFIGLGFIFSLSANTLYGTVFKVYIEDKVSYNEIVSNFDIVNKDNNIVYLQPKENIPWQDEAAS